MENYNTVIDKLNDSEYLLVGLGENFSVSSENMKYLEHILQNRNYFILSMASDKDIDNYSIDSNKIALPFADEENERWDEYLSFLQNTINKKLVLLELGVGFFQPEVIRFPFEKTVFYNQKSTLIRVNKSFYQLTKEIKERGISFKEEPGVFLKQLFDLMN